MILQALYDYYHRKVTELAPFGFEYREIPFIIVLDNQGNFVNLEDTRELYGKKLIAKKFLVPQSEKRTGSKSWQTAFLLWDNLSYVLGCSKNKEQEAKKKHQIFIQQIKEFFDGFNDVGITAVINFLQSKNFDAIFNYKLWQEMLETNPNLSFKLFREQKLICERNSVFDFIAKKITVLSEEQNDSKQQGICLITGEKSSLSKTHRAIKGFGDTNIVSFNKNAFESYNKKQCYNAPVSKKANFAYTTALNHLLSKESKNKFFLRDSTVVFWAEKSSEMEDIMGGIFGEAKNDPDRHTEAVKSLYSSIYSGKLSSDEGLLKFYVLALVQTKTRLAVSFWQESTVAELAVNIKQHFEDLKIIYDQETNEIEFISIPKLIDALKKKKKQKNDKNGKILYKEIKDQGDLSYLVNRFIKSILAGLPYPALLMQAVIQRIRADQRINYSRAALLKAYLNRYNHFYKSKEEEIKMSLDKENCNTSYCLGRLFAVLHKIHQEKEKSSTDNTILERYYGAASANPASIFPVLLRLKNYHLAKLEKEGRKINLEKLIGEIINKLTAIPAVQNLQDQARFALGYYHQRQDFFVKHQHETIGE